MSSKKSIHRYKDYCVKRAAKAKLIDLINQAKLDRATPTVLRLFIDNQPTSTDGFYNLKESIFEEFSSGINNFDYGTYYEPIFYSLLSVETTYCDSRYHFLIQASDILANHVFGRTNHHTNIDFTPPNHTNILLP